MPDQPLKNPIVKAPKVLIVDDNAENIKLIGNVLKLNHFEIAVATDGESALNYTHLKNIDLILLDILMPGVDGFEICKRLKANPETSEIPVIFLTASTDAQFLVKGFQTGGVDYITKPFEPSELIARVTTHIELKRSRDLIMIQKNELEELNQLKNKFFSIMSHDLRSPLTNILTFGDYLKFNLNDFTKEELISYIEQFSTSVKNLYKLIENLLEWSKLQMNKVEMDIKPINLYHKVNEVIQFIELNAKEKNVKLMNQLETTCMVFADENMLKSVLQNLMVNALKFSHPGSQVQIFSQKNDTLVEIGVKDLGVGMSENTLKRLFRMDALTSTPGTNREKGTGLGLIITKEFVERMGGNIRIESREKAGTTFFFTLRNAAQ